MSLTPSAAVVGFAGCTSLGYSMAATLAAMGAGLSNFTSTGLKTPFGTDVMAAGLLERDLPRIERLRGLTSLGVRELEPLLAELKAERVPVLLGIPSGLDDDEQEAMHEVLRGSASVHEELTWFPYGRASGFAALNAAMEVLKQGEHRFVAVAGIDSLCSLDTVHRLVQLGRVLGPHTEGSIPGEAAVFAVLARATDPVVDPARSVSVGTVARHRAPVPFGELDRVSAEGLATLFRVFRERGEQPVDRVIAAHSGDGYFGRSFAHAYLREMDIMPEPLEVDTTADCVGDVGAASGPLGLAYGMYQMVTNPHDGERRALVYTESDTGELGAAIMAGEPTSWERMNG